MTDQPDGGLPEFGAWDWSAFGLGGPAPREASAEARSAARQVRSFYDALLEQGFNHESAVFLAGTTLNGAAMGQALGQAWGGGGL